MQISWIEDGQIACGSIPVSMENIQSLHYQGIRAILTLTEHPLTAFKVLPPTLFERMGITLVHIPVTDFQPPTVEQVKTARDAVRQMQGAKKPVYLHCHAGVGRTGTMLHGIYLLNGMSLDQAKDYIKQRRPTSQFIMLSETQRAFLEKLAAEQQNQKPHPPTPSP